MSGATAHPPRWLATAYRAVIRGYPRAWQRRYGDEQLSLFADLWRDERPPRPVAAWRWSIAQLWRAAVAGIRLHWDRAVSDMSTGPGPRRRWSGDVGDDVRFALRRLRRRPAATLGAVAALAAGMGAAAATWSVVSAVLLHPFPVKDAERLAQMNVAYAPRPGSNSGERLSTDFTYRWYERLRTTDAFDGLAAGGEWSFLTDTGAGAVSRAVFFASPDYFETLGVVPVLGRAFAQADNEPGAPLTAVLSFKMWRDALASDPAVIGRPLTVAGKRVVIVGVAPEGFRGLRLSSSPDFYMPARTVADLGDPRMNYLDVEGADRVSTPTAWIRIVGRVPGQRSFQETVERLASLWPEWRGLARFDLVSLNDAALPASARGTTTQFIRLLVATVALLLLAGCLTVGMLLLHRADARRHELATCLALGATRSRLVRGIFIEGLLIAAAASVVSVPISLVIFGSLQAFQLPGGVDLGSLGLAVNLRTLAGVALAALVASAALALISAAVRLPRNISEVQRAAAGAGTRAKASWLRGSLVAVEIAVAFLLVTGAGLFARTLLNVLRLNPGVGMRQLVMMSINLGPYGYAPADVARFFDDLRQRLSANPVAEAVAIYSPQGGMSGRGSMVIDGERRPVPSFVGYMGIDDQYFGTMGLPLVRGKPFSEEDRAGAPRVAIVSESFGRFIANGGDPLGRRITESHNRPGQPADVVEVVGVVPDVVVNMTDQAPCVMYMPLAQLPALTARSLLVRASGDPTSAGAAIVAAVKSLDPRITGAPPQSLPDRLLGQMGPQRLALTVFAALGLTAVTLAALGVYVLVQTRATVRRREFAIRAALGATGGQLAGLMLGETGRLVGLGLLVGLVASTFATRLVAAFLFNVSAFDPVTLAVGSLLLLALAQFVSLGPVTGATRVSLVDTLREE